MSLIKRNSNLIRAAEWFFSKIPFNLSVIFLLAIQADYSINFYWCFQVMLWMISFLGIAGFGYFLNNVFDIKEDNLAGKSNSAAELSPIQRISTLVILLVIGFLPWFLLPCNLLILSLLSVQIIILCLYSIPPIRLKAVPFLGICSDVLYGYILPFFITTILFEIIYKDIFFSSALIVFTLIWLCLVGLRNIIGHHVIDAQGDALSKKTSFNLSSYIDVSTLTDIVLPLITLIEVFNLVCIFYALPVKGWWLISLLVAFWIIHYFVSNPKIYWSRFTKTEYSYFDQNLFYEHWLPFFLALVWLGFSYSFYLWLVVLTFLFSNLIGGSIFYDIIRVIYYDVFIEGLLNLLKRFPSLYERIKRIYRGL